ncbi:MAG: hypothetical protein ISQ09_05390 [Rubripirellula sp.]|nr:hypothetical protein [Rubripirellula sp.]
MKSNHDKNRGFGGVIHSYQKYDPISYPPPNQPPADLVSPAFEQALWYGDFQSLSDEDLARAVRLDPSQVAGLGPSLDALRAILEERKQRILNTYEVKSVQKKAKISYQEAARKLKVPKKQEKLFRKAVTQEQPYLLERLWYHVGDDQSNLANGLLRVLKCMSEKHQIEQLESDYEFLGRESLKIDEAIAIKEELENIDALLKQLAEARETAQIGLIDLESLADYVQPSDLSQLEEMRRQVESILRDQAERQGLEKEKGAGGGYRLTPQAYKIFQGKLLERLFSQLSPSKHGRHDVNLTGEGSVELQSTSPYEFGDSLAHLDLTQSVINSLIRQGGERPLNFVSSDMEVYQTRHQPKCATCVIMDMSGSMRYDGQYVNVKRMALALQGLIQSEYPGDFLRFIEMYTFAKLCAPGEIIQLMPKPVTIHDPWVQLWADMSDPEISEQQIHPHFTNIQHSLQLARKQLMNSDTSNRQVVLITDGLPTAHFEEEKLFMLYPPDPRTEMATMREAAMLQKEGITINIFLVPSWSQSQEDIRFAQRLAQSTGGRVAFTSGKDLDRFVLWDYVQNRREIIA